jgi:hypothetical protein
MTPGITSPTFKMAMDTRRQMAEVLQSPTFKMAVALLARFPWPDHDLRPGPGAHASGSAEALELSQPDSRLATGDTSPPAGWRPPRERSAVDVAVILSIVLTMLAAPREIAKNAFEAVAVVGGELAHRWHFAILLVCMLVVLSLRDD